MTELLALQSSETILNTIVKNKKPSNQSWSLGSEYLNRVAVTAFDYTSNYEAIITALNDAWSKGEKSVADIQHAYMIGSIVKYLRRANTKGDGKITQDYITQADVILGKKNLTKMVTTPTDNHRTQTEQNMYQAAAMAFSRLKDKAGLPKQERNPKPGNVNTPSDGTNSLSPKDLKMDKIETELDGMKVLDMLASLMTKLIKEKNNAFSEHMVDCMNNFRADVAKLHEKK